MNGEGEGERGERGRTSGSSAGVSRGLWGVGGLRRFTGGEFVELEEQRAVPVEASAGFDHRLGSSRCSGENLREIMRREWEGWEGWI